MNQTISASMQQSLFAAQPSEEIDLDALDAVIPGFSHLGKIFDQMEIAEDEISAAKLRNPNHADALQSSFMPLRWMLDSPVRNEVFRSHARELLQRVVDGAPLAPATKAELMMVLANTSVNAPMNSRGAALYHALFRAVFPERVNELIGEPEPEPWEGANDELISELRRKHQFPR